jgi:hypothetical protein
LRASRDTLPGLGGGSVSTLKRLSLVKRYRAIRHWRGSASAVPRKPPNRGQVANDEKGHEQTSPGLPTKPKTPARGTLPGSSDAGQRRRARIAHFGGSAGCGFILAAIVTPIVTMIAVSSGHIEVTMVPMPVSGTDVNSDWTDSDFDVFRDDHRFVGGAQGASKCRHG